MSEKKTMWMYRIKKSARGRLVEREYKMRRDGIFWKYDGKDRGMSKYAFFVGDQSSIYDGLGEYITVLLDERSPKKAAMMMMEQVEREHGELVEAEYRARHLLKRVKKYADGSV